MDDHFDVAILGTGLTESILAAALGKAGYRVAHIDTNQHYGADEASLSGDETISWIDSFHGEAPPEASEYSSFFKTGEIPPPSRSYYVSLSPSVIPAKGPLIDTLIASGVASYGGYKLLNRISVFSESKGFQNVPGDKKEIFKTQDLELKDKRKLMRFLMFAAGSFEDTSELQGKEEENFLDFLQGSFFLPENIATTVAFALALNQCASAKTLDSLRKIRKFLKSTGRYGASPFLIGQYGGLGEIVQGFCRVCAVSGGMYVLGHDFSVSSAPSGSPAPKMISLKSVEMDMPQNIIANIIVSSPQYLRKVSESQSEAQSESLEDSNSSQAQLCGIVLVDGELHSAKDDESESNGKVTDGAVFVYPPGELHEGAATGPVKVLVYGEGTMSCPRGKSLIYLNAETSAPEHEINPETILRPYLSKVISTQLHPASSTHDVHPPIDIFSTFYTKRPTSAPSPSLVQSLKDQKVLLTSTLPVGIAENGDAAAQNAEVLFKEALRALGKSDAEVEATPYWPPLPEIDEDDIIN